MKNKVLIELLVPDVEEKFSVFLPINKKIGNIIILLNKAVREMTNNQVLFLKDTNCLYNRENGKRYNPREIIKNTDIRNGTNLILM